MDVSQAVIEVEQLMKRYGDFTAVNGVDFTVYQGEVFGLLGPNGAGKTTTMEMIEGLRQPDSGSAKVAGFDTRHDLSKVKEVIGVQLQSTSLFEFLKVEEIVRLYASFYRQSLPVKPLLADVTLTEKANALVKTLSGGQKQRLAIALALVNDPRVVFLDEPTTGLDPQARRVLWDIISAMKEKGKTIILSTHYMEEAQILCDRICLMDSGKVIALDTPGNLVRSLRTQNAIEFQLSPATSSTRTKDFVETLKTIQGVVDVDVKDDIVTLHSTDVQSSLVDLLHLTSSRGVTLTDLRTRSGTLEDVFLHLTGRGLREE